MEALHHFLFSFFFVFFIFNSKFLNPSDQIRTPNYPSDLYHDSSRFHETFNGFWEGLRDFGFPGMEAGRALVADSYILF